MRVIHPTTKYAIGLICGARPDLAERIKTAFYGEDPHIEFQASDFQGVNAVRKLIKIHHSAEIQYGTARDTLSELAEILKLSPDDVLKNAPQVLTLP